jgi:hypothetical protein
MCTITNPAPPVKPSKSAVTRVDCDRAVKGTGALWFLNIWQGDKLSTYWLLPLVSDFGVAFRFECSRTGPVSEMQADHYDVLLELDGASCECPGFLRWGGECKHISALKLLVERGILG